MSTRLSPQAGVDSLSASFPFRPFNTQEARNHE